MKSLLAIILFITCIPLGAQTPTFDELEFEPDSLRTPYKPVGKNYVTVRSKRGTSGVNKTPAADAITSAEVSEIVLVFSELNPSDIAEREEANRERWENLLKTYPEFFQFSTTYKNVCQCNDNGDSAAFKKAQGFYVYVNGEVPKVEEPKAVAAATPPAPEKTAEPVKTQAAAPATKAKTEPKTEQKAAPVAVTTPEAVVAEPVKEVPAKEAAKEPEPAAPAAEETASEVKTSPKKKTATAKARRAKDPRACRPACYGYGDEDLIAFFKDNITLTKKQRRKAKNWVANVRLQIHFDGTIKKAMVTGSNEEFNLKVQDILKSMNNWNTAVKNGVAVKSEVRFTVKYDSQTKSMKPFDIMANPKASAKCPCISDGEMFND